MDIDLKPNSSTKTEVSDTLPKREFLDSFGTLQDNDSFVKLQDNASEMQNLLYASNDEGVENNKNKENSKDTVHILSEDNVPVKKRKLEENAIQKQHVMVNIRATRSTKENRYRSSSRSTNPIEIVPSKPVIFQGLQASGEIISQKSKPPEKKLNPTIKSKSLVGNPWAVPDLDEYLCYCCPECFDLQPTKEKLISHALDNHPKAHVLLVHNPQDLAEEIGDSQDVEIEYQPEIVKHELDEVNQDIIITSVWDNEISEDIFKCSECNLDLVSKESYNHHMLMVHKVKTDDEVLKCKFCQMGFYEKKELLKHVRINHKPKVKLECPDCEMTFTKKFHRDKHAIEVHGKVFYNQAKSERKKHVCQACNKEFVFLSGLKVHEYTEHQGLELGTCGEPGCFQTFHNKQQLVRHLTVVHLATHKCDLCGNTFPHPSNLKQHKIQKHSDGKEVAKDFTCEICGKEFPRVGKLNAHKKLKHPENPYPCEICGEILKNYQTLAHHKFFRHGPATRFPCGLCDKDFRTKSKMEQHKRYYHMGIIEFKCDRCGKAFPNNKELQKHIKILHDGIKNYKCDYCDKAFSTNQNKKVHIKSAHGEDRFSNGAPQKSS